MNPKLMIVTPLLFALASAPFASAQAKSGNQMEQKAAGAAAKAAVRPDARPIEDLRLAAQRLRDAIHQMAREPASPKRNELIKAADRALAQVETAMTNLPPALLTAEATESHYKEASDKLEIASENLREAAQSLATDPDSQRRNETMQKIKTALQETHRLMHEIPRGTSGT